MCLAAGIRLCGAGALAEVGVAGGVAWPYDASGPSPSVGGMAVRARLDEAPCVEVSGREPRMAASLTLLERIGGGDAGAVRECIDRFSGLIWSLARRAGLNGAEAEDAVQEIFVEIWRSAGRYRPDIASETAFVATIARRRLIDARRRIGRRPVTQALGEDGAAAPAGAPISDRSEVNQEAARAAEALRQLSNEQQRVLRLSVFEGLSHEKIATATGLPLGTVKTHARRGLIRIRAMLEAGGGAGNAIGGSGTGDGGSIARAGDGKGAGV